MRSDKVMAAGAGLLLGLAASILIAVLLLFVWLPLRAELRSASVSAASATEGSPQGETGGGAAPALSVPVTVLASTPWPTATSEASPTAPAPSSTPTPSRPAPTATRIPPTATNAPTIVIVVVTATNPPPTATQPPTLTSTAIPPTAAPPPTNTAAPPAVAGDITTYDFASEMLYRVNQDRCTNGLAPLTINGQLNAAALTHSIDMASNNYFGHTGTDGSGVATRVSAQGYSWFAVGENIAAGPPDSATVHSLWMNSPGHRANIMNPDYREMGLGVVSRPGTSYGYYWTQVFGSSGSAPITCAEAGF